MVLFSNLSKIKLIPLFGLIFCLLLIEAPSLCTKKSSSSKDLVSERGGPCPPTFKCDCCFTDEISFGALDMYKDHFNVNPDGLVTFDCVDLFAIQTLYWKYTSTNLTVPLNMQFEVPKDIDTSRNVAIDIHFIVQDMFILPEAIKFPVKVTGLFAGQCAPLFRKFCAEQCVSIPPCVPIPSTVFPPSTHFTVTFCINPKGKIHPSDFGQLSISLANLLNCPFPGLINETPFEIGILAASFRYHKKECSTKQPCSPAINVECPSCTPS